MLSCSHSQSLSASCPHWEINPPESIPTCTQPKTFGKLLFPLTSTHKSYLPLHLASATEKEQLSCMGEEHNCPSLSCSFPQLLGLSREGPRAEEWENKHSDAIARPLSNPIMDTFASGPITNWILSSCFFPYEFSSQTPLAGISSLS